MCGLVNHIQVVSHSLFVSCVSLASPSQMSNLVRPLDFAYQFYILPEVHTDALIHLSRGKVEFYNGFVVSQLKSFNIR